MMRVRVCLSKKEMATTTAATAVVIVFFRLKQFFQTKILLFRFSLSIVSHLYLNVCACVLHMIFNEKQAKHSTYLCTLYFLGIFLILVRHICEKSLKQQRKQQKHGLTITLPCFPWETIGLACAIDTNTHTHTRIYTVCE